VDDADASLGLRSGEDEATVLTAVDVPPAGLLEVRDEGRHHLLVGSPAEVGEWRVRDRRHVPV